MSQAPHETVNVPNASFGTGTTLSRMTLSSPFSPTPAAEIGDYQYPPQSPQNQVSQGVSDFVDGSGPIFSMYLEMAAEEDKKMAESWKADADGILIFVRRRRSLSSYVVLHTDSNGHRLVYSPPLLQHLSPCRFRISDRIHRTLPTFTLPISTGLLPTQMDPTSRVPSLLHRPHSLHQTMPFGLTLFGS